VRDLEASSMRRLWPALDHSVTGKTNHTLLHYVRSYGAPTAVRVKASVLTEFTVLLNLMNMLCVQRVCVRACVRESLSYMRYVARDV